MITCIVGRFVSLIKPVPVYIKKLLQIMLRFISANIDNMKILWKYEMIYPQNNER